MTKPAPSSGQPAMVDPLNDRPRLPSQYEVLKSRPVEAPKPKLSLWRRG